MIIVTVPHQLPPSCYSHFDTLLEWASAAEESAQNPDIEDESDEGLVEWARHDFSSVYHWDSWQEAFDWIEDVQARPTHQFAAICGQLQSLAEEDGWLEAT